jgi:hypothetical protein
MESTKRIKREDVEQYKASMTCVIILQTWIASQAVFMSRFNNKEIWFQ